MYFDKVTKYFNKSVQKSIYNLYVLPQVANACHYIQHRRVLQWSQKDT